MSGPVSPRTAYATLNVPYKTLGASLAQLAEHALRKRMVAGSIPAGGLQLKGRCAAFAWALGAKCHQWAATPRLSLPACCVLCSSRLPPSGRGKCGPGAARASFFAAAASDLAGHLQL